MATMTIVEQILASVGMRQRQASFMKMLLGLWLAIPGRINYANLERFSDLSERSYRSWFDKPVEWVGINSGIVVQLQDQGKMGKRLIMGVDTSNVSKAGKCTPGVGKFWDSKVGKAVSSLELSCCSLIDLQSQQAIPVHALQTPGELAEGVSRVNHYVAHMQDVLGSLPANLRAQIECVVADAWYTKKTFVDGVLQRGMHYVGKLRIDANLKYLYTGGPTGKPGRPRVFDGKVDFSDFSKWTLIAQDETTTIYSAILYSPALERKIRVVCELSLDSKGKTKRELFFSTNLDMLPLEIITTYRSRFQMEFPFRDAKQFAGLMDCQSRQPSAIEFHWNAALLTTSLAKADQLLAFQGLPQDFVFSMEDAKRKAYNQLFAQTIIQALPLNLTFDNCLPLIQSALNLGVKAA